MPASFGQRWMESPQVVRIYEGRFRPLVTRLVGGPSYAQEEAFLERWCQPAGEGPILDLACGTGRYTGLLQRRFGDRVVGLDLSEPMLQVAARHGAPLVGGSAQSLPFRDASLAAVSTFGALHLFPDPRAALVEMGRVLRPGGSLTVFAALRADSALQRVFPVVGWVPEDEIRRGLEDGGLTLEAWEPHGWMVLLASSRG